MSKPNLLRLSTLLLLAISCRQGHKENDTTSQKLPNFIIIFTDDQGYGDLSCFGATHVKTPNIDKLAQQGIKLTSFYVAAPVCTPSRAALMTGCYPKRVDMTYGGQSIDGKPFVVTLAADPKGLNPDEITIAEVLKTQGYATGIFGKWHLGDQPEFLPTRQGFDEFFGIPYSHDIHSNNPRQGKRDGWNFPLLPLLDGEKVVEMEPDADYLTKRITERTVQFIEAHKDRPFFIYVPHPIPHSPLHVSPDFMETVPDSIRSLLNQEDGFIDYETRDNLYPQAISEIDWSVGQIVAALQRHGLDSNTLVLFTTDNGPGPDLATAGLLRGRKGTTFEGGMRVPTVAWWPGEIKAGTESNQLLTAMDLLPTFGQLAGAELPMDRVIDGKDIWPVLSGQAGAKSPHERFYYYFANELRAVRSGPWKYHQMLVDREDPDASPTALYNLDTDIGESQDLAAQHLEIVERLKGYLEDYERELGKGDSLSSNVRRAAWVENPKALTME